MFVKKMHREKKGNVRNKLLQPGITLGFLTIKPWLHSDIDTSRLARSNLNVTFAELYLHAGIWNWAIFGFCFQRHKTACVTSLQAFSTPEEFSTEAANNKPSLNTLTRGEPRLAPGPPPVPSLPVHPPGGRFSGFLLLYRAMKRVLAPAMCCVNTVVWLKSKERDRQNTLRHIPMVPGDTGGGGRSLGLQRAFISWQVAVTPLS